MGVLYILDEPSIGLHQRDNAKLIATLTRLRDLGNTVLVVEHDEETIRTADWVVDIGPGAASTAARSSRTARSSVVLAEPRSITGAYLRGERQVPIPEKRRKGNGKRSGRRGRPRAQPAQGGPPRSRSGRSWRSPACPAAARARSSRRSCTGRWRASSTARAEPVGAHDGSRGSSTSTRSSRSTRARSAGRRARTRRPTPACSVRSASCSPVSPEGACAATRPGRFSFNVKGGRCENCKGDGILKIEMQFLPDVYVPCEVCKGKRYNREALEIHYKGRSIADVLEMTIAEALEFFSSRPEGPHQAPDAVRRRPRLRPPRPAGDDALGRRGPAGQAGDRAVAARDRADALRPRRADDRAALRGRREAARGAPPARRRRQHGPRHRAQPRRHQDGRLDHRPRAGGRRAGRARSSPRARPRRSPRPRARRPASTWRACFAASRSCRCRDVTFAEEAGRGRTDGDHTNGHGPATVVAATPSQARHRRCQEPLTFIGRPTIPACPGRSPSG